jgi:hypothetical protein
LTVVVGQTATLLRCARLSGDPLGEGAASLVSEIRLTMAAANNQLARQKVERIVLLGSGADHTRLAETIRGQLSVAVEQFDPFARFKLEGELSRALPPHAGRFAPLLGLAAEELAGRAPVIDFLHPRRPPEPPSRRNQYVVAALAGTLLALTLILAAWYQRSSLQNEVQRLQAESRGLDKKVTQSQKSIKAGAEVDQWVGGEIVWLDELRWLSQKFPSAEDAMLTQLKMSNPGEAGEMTLDGLARNVDAVAKLDQGLHDAVHRVSGKTKSERQTSDRYHVQFRSSLLVSPRKP